jgi:hypothetical protein
MSFSLSSDEITQTGTDTDLSGLSAISGITTYTWDMGDTNVIVYYTNNRRLIVEGTLSWSPENEMLVFAQGVPANNRDGILAISSGGNLTIGGTTTAGNSTRYLRGLALRMCYSEGTAFDDGDSGIRVASGGTMTVKGATLEIGQDPHVFGTALLEDCTIRKNGSLTRWRSKSSNATYRNCTFLDMPFWCFENPASVDGLAVLGGEILIYGDNTGSWNVISLSGLDFSASTTDYDMRFIDRPNATVKNTSTGAGTRVARYSTGGDRPKGYLSIQKETSFNFTDAIGSPISGVKGYAIDTDNGNRKDLNGFNDTADKTYSFTSDGAGLTETRDVVIAIYNNTNDTLSVDANEVFTDGDLRVKDTDGTSYLDFGFIEYNYNIVSIVDFDLSGTDATPASYAMILDSLITESTKATVDAYATIDNAFELYDRAKSELYDVYAGETTTTVIREGNTIDAGSYNVTIDATAGSAFAFDGSTITIKASTFTGNINTSGTVTLSNGAVLDGVVNGQLEVTDGATYTADIDGKFVVNTDTVTSFTIDGFIPTEIEHIGSGSATIIGTNNAKLVGTTITATGGTLNLGDGLNPSSNYTEVAGSPNVITLSGTETDLLGMRGLEFVDYVQNGNSYTYSLDENTILELDGGDLLIDPAQDKLILNADAVNNTTSNPIRVINSSTFRVGVFQNINGVDVYSTGVALELLGTAVNPFAYFMLFVDGASTFNWNGGTIRTNGSLRFDHLSTLNQNNGIMVELGSVQSHFRLTPASTAGGANLNINNLILDGLTSPSRFFTSWGFNQAVFTLRRGLVQQYNGNYPEQVYLNFDNVNNVNAYDFGFTNTVEARGANIVFVNVGKRITYQSSNNRYGYIKVFRSVSLTPKDLEGTGITFSYYGQDFDSGLRRVGPNDGGTDADSQSVDQDDTATKTYSDQDATGSASIELLIEVVTNFNDDIDIDDRTSSDTIPLKFVGYNESITTWNSSLIGIGTLTEDVVMTPDLSITEATRATVDAYTELETPQKLYDRAKSELVAVYAGEAETTISREGNTINAGSYDVTIDATAVNAYDLTGNLITIKASTFTGNINTSGTVTLSNGAVLNGVVNGQLDVTDGATYTEDIDGKFVVDTDTVTSFTISGFTPTEIEHIGSGTATVNGTNNAKINNTTITATGGTLVLGDNLVASANYSEDISGTKITLTGTESGLVGLRGLERVNYFEKGDVTEYVIDGMQLNIEGSLSYNATSERIVFQNMTSFTKAGVYVGVGGDLSIISEKEVNSINTIFPSQLAIDFGAFPANSVFNKTGAVALVFADGGVGSLSGKYNFGKVSGQESGVRVGAFDSGDVTLTNIILEDELSGSNSQVRIVGSSTNYVVTNAVLIGCSLTLASSASLSEFSNVAIQNNNETVVLAVNPLNGFHLIRDLSPTNAGTTLRINSNGNTQHAKLVNFSGGASEFAYANNDPAENNRCALIKEFDFRPEDENGVSISGVYYAVDTDNGSRSVDYAENSTGKIYGCSGDIVYSGEQSSGIVEYAYAFGNTDNSIDNRGENADGDITWRWLAYDRNIASVSPSCVGNETLIVSFALLPDSLITESNLATVDAYTNATLATARNIYDFEKSLLVANYIGETDTYLTREGSVLNLTNDSITFDNSAGAFAAFSGALHTIHTPSYTGGITTTGTISQLNGAILNDLDIIGATWNAVQTTWTGSADADTTIDVANAGTYDVTGFTFDASTTLNNSSGGAITLVLSSGQQQPTVTGDAVNFQTAGITLTITDVASSAVQVMDDSGTVMDREASYTGTYTYNTPNGSTGTWCVVVNRAGYNPRITEFSPTDGNVSLTGVLSQKTKADGSAMYSGSSSAFIAVTTQTDGSRMNLRIGDGIVSAQAAFDESEVALQTEDGIRYLCAGGGQVTWDQRPTGTFLDLGTNVRLIRDNAGDANATVAAFVSSTDGVVLDGTNGSVAYVQPTSDVNLVSVGGEAVTGADDLKADVSTIDSNVDSIKTKVDSNLNATVSSRASSNQLVGIETTILDHGDDSWTTATGFATPTNVTDARDAVTAAIGGLNDISTSDIDARLAVYDMPTLAEMTAAFTEIKGAGWTTTDTLEAIRSSISSGGVSAADVWSYATRGLTEDVATDEASRLASQADVSTLATFTQVDNLHNISVEQVAASLEAYDAPTLAETVAIISEIKGAGWSASDTLKAIKDNLGLTAAQEAQLSTIETNTNRVDGLIEDDGGDQFTAKSVSQAPAGGDASKADLAIINEGVKKASIMAPHEDDLT